MTRRPYNNVGVILLVLAAAFVGYLRLVIVEKHDNEQQAGAFRGWSVTNSTQSSVRLYVVYHVGPAKMGSTSIQIGALQKYHDELQRDGYNVYDFRQASKLNDCLSKTTVTTCQSQQEWSHFMKFMKTSTQHRRHVLISTENHWNHFGNDTSLLSAYQHIFDTFDYQVRIVIGYRPLLDFWQSAYYQEYSHYCGHAHGKDVRTIPPLLDFIKRQNETHQCQHPSYAAVQHVSQFFHDIVILPLGEHFIERFLCNVVIRASHACAAVQQQHDSEAIENHGHSLALDRLAQAARLHGCSKKPCKTMSNSIQDKLQQENMPIADLPRTCLDESQRQWLVSKSLFYQHALVPTDHGDIEIQLKQASICQVNVDEILMDYPYLFAAENMTRPP